MRKEFVILSLGMLLAVTGTAAGDFAVTSPQLQEGGRLGDAQVFSGFGCDGKNISPALQWKGAPQGTKSFALTVYDPDAPTGSGWWHWVIFNIPATATGLAENAGKPDSGLAPTGSIQSMTDFGKPGFGGACPPKGDKPHRYIFTVHALSVDKLPLEASSPAAMVGFFLNRNSLGKATLTVYFSRDK